MQLLVSGNRIERMGPAGSFPAPADARTIDAAGKTVLPGFFDAHFHIADDVTLVPAFVARGITSARDPGAWMELFEPVKKWQQENHVPAPRLFLCGPHLDGPGPAYPTDSVVILSPPEARRVVQKQVAQGATAIKVYFRLPVESIHQASYEAHRLGVPVTAHLEIIDPRDAVEAGVDGIEHITSLGIALIPPMEAERYRQAILKENNARRDGRYEMWARINPESPQALELARFLAKHGTYVDPNLAVFERQPGDKQENIEMHVKGFRNMLAYVGVLHREGVPIVVGSHSNAPHAPRGLAYHREMELLVEAGMTPMQVLVAATRTGARFFRRERDLGTIEEGKLADLVIVDGNPLEDIRKTRNVVSVIVDGRPLDPAEVLKLTPPVAVKKN
jgi:imidazolonepropionase-like amidohydrolase